METAQKCSGGCVRVLVIGQTLSGRLEPIVANVVGCGTWNGGIRQNRRARG